MHKSLLMVVLFCSLLIAPRVYGAEPAGCITQSMLKNMKYPVSKTSAIQMRNGHYVEPQAVEADVTDIMIGEPATNAVQHAAVIITQNYIGGTGHDMLLYIVRYDCAKKTGNVTGPRSLGDRVSVKLASVKGNVATVSGTFHGPKDPQCCPTQKKTLMFKRTESGTLEEVKN